MRICKICSAPMYGVMSSNNKHGEFERCRKCRGKTKNRNIKDSELSFGEVLSKAIMNRK